jgi:hypothetical protein
VVSIVISALRTPSEYVTLASPFHALLTYAQHITVPVYGKGVVHDVANEVFMEQKRFTKLGMSTDHFRVHVGMSLPS